jgi:outer membrane protein OmpA-like peptidoglycan-associated protein
MRCTAALIVSLSASFALPVAARQVTGTTDSAQQPTSTYQGQIEPMKETPTYRVNVVSRSTSAVNYRHRAGSTEVNFRGTSIMPEVKGKATVESKRGRLEIHADLDKLKPATFFGPEYLTYVLWAITPEGRALNLGEVIPNSDGDADIRVTTDLQAFGLIVTAEPYFAVTRPGDLIVADNEVRRDTKGWEQPITARFDAIERGQYTITVNPTQLPATGADRKKYQPEMLQALNAVAIAKASGAQQYAPEALARSEEFLARGEDYVSRKQSKSAIGTVARGAAQAAEDARVLAIRRREEHERAEERRIQQQRAEDARLKAEQESARASLADEQRLAAERAKQEAQTAAEEAARQRAEADAARQAAIAQQQQSALKAQQAEQARQQAEQARQQAEQARLQAEQQAQQTRARLMQQLNQVLQTRDSARGLIVNMSDVLFDLNKATLRPGARERLARVAGIILAYPDLRLQIEGHTDSTGSETYNQQLSEKRAESVREYLTEQGVTPENITAQGYGELKPLTSNANAAGRQQNRRVELVVSGDVIESAQSESTTTTTTTTTQPGGVASGTSSTVPVQPAPTQPITSPAGSTPQTTAPPPSTPMENPR